MANAAISTRSSLLKRVQGANAETQSREAQALARATATEAREARRAEVTIRGIENEREQLLAQTRLAVATEKQRATVFTQQAARDAEAKTAGIKSQTEAEKERIEMLRAQYNAEILVPAAAEKERLILEARAAATAFTGQAQAEIDQLRQTVEILRAGGETALQAYLVENFDRFITPFARTLDLIPVGETSVITGAGGNHAPMSAVHPHPLEMEKARRLQDAFGAVGLPVVSTDNYASVPSAAIAADGTDELITADIHQTESSTPPKQEAAPGDGRTQVETQEPVQGLSGTLQAYLQKRKGAELVHKVGEPQTMGLDPVEFDDR